jgi:hypothetical protein
VRCGVYASWCRSARSRIGRRNAQENDVPKSKVRKKPESQIRPQPVTSATRQLAPSPRWYPIVMAGVLVLGLAYLIVYYLTNSGTSPHMPFMGDIGGWNFAVGFGIMIVGLIMAVRWR